MRGHLAPQSSVQAGGHSCPPQGPLTSSALSTEVPGTPPGPTTVPDLPGPSLLSLASYLPPKALSHCLLARKVG